MDYQISYESAAQALADPATTPGELRDIAIQHPALGTTVAAHPQCYPELAMWATAQWQAQMDSSIAARAPQPDDSTMPVTLGSTTGPAKGRKVFPIVLAVIGVLALAGTAVGAVTVYQNILGPDGRALDSARAFPAATVALAEVSIEPSTQQKLNLAGLIPKLDGLQALLEQSHPEDELLDDASDSKRFETDLRPLIWEHVAEAMGMESDFDYDTDFAPWIGGTISIGLIGDHAEASTAWLVAIASSDDPAGEAAVQRFVNRVETDQRLVVEARNGYVYVHHVALNLNMALESGVLTDTPAFAAISPYLGERGLVSAWSNPHGVTTAVGTWLNAEGDFDAASIYLETAGSLDVTGSEVATLRSIAGGLEWEGAATQFAIGSEWHAYQDAGRLLGELPGSTAIGVAAAGLGSSYDRALTREALAQQIAPGVTNFGSSGIGLSLFTFGVGSVSEWEARINEDAQDFEAEWGVTRAEVGALLNDGVVFAIDQDLACDQYQHVEECSQLGVGLRVHTARSDLAERILDRAEAEYGISLDRAVASDRVTIGQGPYVANLHQPGTPRLSSSRWFARALPDAERASFAALVTGPALGEALTAWGVEMDAVERGAFDDFGALGTTVVVDDNDVAVYRTRLLVND